MKKIFVPWLILSCLLPCYATAAGDAPATATVSEAAAPLPAWLLEIQQKKFQKPQQMLQIALAKEAESAKWPVALQASYFNEIALIYEVLGRHRDQLATAEHALA